MDFGREADFAEEDAEAEECFRAVDGLEKFSSTRGVADGGGEDAGDHEAATASGWFGVLEGEAAVGAAVGAVVQGGVNISGETSTGAAEGEAEVARGVGD